MSKLLAIEIHSAFCRAVIGESVRAIAREYRVTEGALRYHFRKNGQPKAVQKIAFQFFFAQCEYNRLSELEKLAVDEMVRQKKV